MATTYFLADQAVQDQSLVVMKKEELELAQAGVTVHVLFARNPDGPAIKAHGYPAAGKVKINSLADRAKGMPDATITIDHEEWLNANGRRRESLLHHEIHHLLLVFPKATIR